MGRLSPSCPLRHSGPERILSPEGRELRHVVPQVLARDDRAARIHAFRLVSRELHGDGARHARLLEAAYRAPPQVVEQPADELRPDDRALGIAGRAIKSRIVPWNGASGFRAALSFTARACPPRRPHSLSCFRLRCVLTGYPRLESG